MALDYVTWQPIIRSVSTLTEDKIIPWLTNPDSSGHIATLTLEVGLDKDGVEYLIINGVKPNLQVTPAHQVVSEARKLRRLVEKQAWDEKIAEVDQKLEQLK